MSVCNFVTIQFNQMLSTMCSRHYEWRLPGFICFYKKLLKRRIISLIKILNDFSFPQQRICAQVPRKLKTLRSISLSTKNQMSLCTACPRSGQEIKKSKQQRPLQWQKTLLKVAMMLNANRRIIFLEGWQWTEQCCCRMIFTTRSTIPWQKHRRFVQRWKRTVTQ